METNVEARRMSMWEKFSFGMGNFGGNVAYMLVASFFLYYCTDSLGLSSAVIGTLLMVSKFLDGITDVFMGYLINITHTKYGKARFWLLVSAVPYAITTTLLFYMPSFFTGNTPYVYLFIVYILQSAITYTMCNISWVTLMAYATKNSDDRYTMSSFGNILGIIPVVILSFVATGMVDFFGGGKIGWTITAGICGFIAFLTIMWCGLVVKELPEEVLEGSESNGEKVSFIESLKLLLSNKYFWILLGTYLTTYIYSGVQGTAAVYYCSYILNDASAYGWINVAMYAPTIFLIAFVPPIIKKIGARKSNVIGAVLGILGGCIAFINTRSIICVVLSCFVGTIGLLPSYVTLNPLVADAAEYTKLKTGKDISAMFYSCSSVGIKVGAGLGTAVTGFVLSMIGYDGMAAVQTDGALRGITMTFLLAPIIGYAIMAVFFYLLDVNEKVRKMKGE